MKHIATLFASVALGAIAGPAFAQTTAPKPAPAAEEADTRDIVVTGSRIVQNGNNMPTPVTVIAADDLLSTHPTNLAEALNDLPVFAGSRSQASNTGTSGAAGAPATSTNALNVINLRNMGLARTLILYDGHRAPPSTPEGFVDIDTIPQMLLKRVDVVTGGASAVYGSDAITGVVNFVTDTGFTGVKVEAQAGISKYGDDATHSFGVAAGTKLLDDRLHIMGSFNYRNDDGIFSKFDRPWGAELRTLQGDGSAAFPYFQVVGARQNNVTYGGRINNGVLINQQFTTGGVLIPFVNGTKTGQGGTIPPGLPYEIGGDGGFYNGQLRSALKMKQGYGRLDFDITDALTLYASAAYTENDSLAIGNYYTQQNLAIGRTNAFLLPQYATALGTAASFNLGKIFTSIPRSQMAAQSRQLLSTLGLKGKIGDAWNYELAYVRGRGSLAVDQNVAINLGRFFAALDSVVSNGTTVCRASLTNTAYTGCVPLNPFGVNSESQAALNYITTQIGWKTTLESDNLVGSISGSPFSTWAGPVNIALSAEWRRTTEEIISNALPTARANCAGISFNCNANTPQYGVATGSSSVANLPRSTVTVREFAGEVQIPLLRDVTMFKALDVNLAIRHAHYNLAGDAVTWKAGVVWQPAEMLTLRGTLSRDFRAPTIDELFRPTAFSLTNFTDTISGTGVNAPNVATYNGGNPNLKPEIANTLALGIVLKPTNNLSFSLDYFNIKIKNFIFLVQGNSPPEQNICYASKGASPYCALITRGLGLYDPAAAGALTAANAVTAWYQQPINIAQQSTKGFDFEANWRPRIFDRPLGLRFLTTYQPSILFKRAGIVDNDYAGVAFGTNGIQATPKWRVSLFVDFKPTDDITISILERWRSSLKFHSDPTIVVASPNVKDVAYTNLNLAFDIPVGNAKVQTFFNVANLFNVTPPQAGFWGNPNPGQFGEFVLGDDVIGRYFTAGIRAKF